MIQPIRGKQVLAVVSFSPIVPVYSSTAKFGLFVFYKVLKFSCPKNSESMAYVLVLISLLGVQGL